MAKFIEVTDLGGTKRLVNTAWIEEIWDCGDTETSEGATIYFAFQAENAVDQDYLAVLESYEEVKRKVLGAEDGNRKAMVDDAPTVDAVEVVRCGECRNCDKPECPMSGTPGKVSASDFCSYGERSENVKL